MREGCESSCAVSVALTPLTIDIDDEAAWGEVMGSGCILGVADTGEELSALFVLEFEGGIPVKADIHVENMLLFPA
jgi:hypothetical protein